MSEQTTGLVPRLRFPEFREAGEWSIKLLGKLATIVRGGSPRPIDRFVTRDPNGLNWLKIGDVDREAKYVTNTEERVIQEALSKTREVNPGDLIMSNSMSFGRPYILKIKSCIHDGWIAVTKIADFIDSDFLYYLILSNPSQLYFMNAAAGGGVRNLNADIIKLLTVTYPTIPEQQKIAACISSLDVLIAAQADKLDALKTHKKGLMQQLFPREGETVPRLRFPEFREAGEWERKKLGEVAKLYKGKSISKSDITVDGNQPCIRYGELYTIYGELIDKVVSKTNLPSKELFLSVKGDVVIPASGETKIDIATAACVMQENVALGGDLNVIRSALNGVFLSYFLNGALRLEIAKVAQGDTVVHLYKNQLERLNLALPSKEEQQKIANCLSSLDALITAQADKLDALKTHKKGLMQQLFPRPETING